MTHERQFLLGAVISSLLSGAVWPALRKRTGPIRHIGLSMLLLAGPVVGAALSVGYGTPIETRNIVGLVGLIALYIACLEHILRLTSGTKNEDSRR